MQYSLFMYFVESSDTYLVFTFLRFIQCMARHHLTAGRMVITVALKSCINDTIKHYILEKLPLFLNVLLIHKIGCRNLKDEFYYLHSWYTITLSNNHQGKNKYIYYSLLANIQRSRDII